MIGNSQQPQTANFAHTLDIVTDHVAHLVRHCLEEGIAAVEPSEAAQSQWVADVVAMAESRQAASDACTPGYYNNEGTASLRTARNSAYVMAVADFADLLAAQRAAGFAALDKSR